MTENEANEIFAQIASTNPELADVQAPEVDARKDGIYYHATVEGVSFYQVVTDHRVVAMVQVDEKATVAPAEAGLPGLEGVLMPGASVHRISVALPDGTLVLPTSGVTMKAPDGIYNRSMIKAFVMPRLARFLVRLYSIGV